jgi:ADP-ribosyl-[dinitrogen reductase] hydrolase
MIGGIIGDIVGSVYEGKQWDKRNLELFQTFPFTDVSDVLKNTKWVRTTPGWTDDSLCTLALFSAYINKLSPVSELVRCCKKYANDATGFGGNFTKWLDNPVPYGSYANGSIMRIGFINHLDIPLQDKLDLAYDYTIISHNHEDSTTAVLDFVRLIEEINGLTLAEQKAGIASYLKAVNWTETVETLHDKKVFDMNALVTFKQALTIVLESNSFEEVMKLSCYVGGDTDTIACVAGNIAEHLWAIPTDLFDYLFDVFYTDNMEDMELFGLINLFILQYSTSAVKDKDKK